MATRFVDKGDFHHLPWNGTKISTGIEEEQEHLNLLNLGFPKEVNKIREEMPKCQSVIIYHDGTMAQEATHFYLRAANRAK